LLARYALAIVIVAVVVALALRTTDASDSPGWYEKLGPFLGVLAIVVAVVAIAQRRRR
jgi:hypothetical protein